MRAGKFNRKNGKVIRSEDSVTASSQAKVRNKVTHGMNLIVLLRENLLHFTCEKR